MLLYLVPSAGPSSDAWLSPASDQMRRREFIATVGGAVTWPGCGPRAAEHFAGDRVHEEPLARVLKEGDRVVMHNRLHLMGRVSVR